MTEMEESGGHRLPSGTLEARRGQDGLTLGGSTQQVSRGRQDSVKYSRPQSLPGEAVVMGETSKLQVNTRTKI